MLGKSATEAVQAGRPAPESSEEVGAEMDMINGFVSANAPGASQGTAAVVPFRARTQRALRGDLVDLAFALAPDSATWTHPS